MADDMNSRIERLRIWEREQEAKYGKGWEHNPNRHVSIIHDYPPPEGVNVVLCGSKITNNSISLSEWLKRHKDSQSVGI